MTRKKRVQPGQRIPIRLTDRERKLVLEHTFIGGELERHVRFPSLGAGASVPSVLGRIYETKH